MSRAIMALFASVAAIGLIVACGTTEANVAGPQAPASPAQQARPTTAHAEQPTLAAQPQPAPKAPTTNWAPVKMLDACSVPADPVMLAGAVKMGGANAVGLYAVNWSAPHCVVDASYAQRVQAEGVQVLPIVTPGNSPGDPAQAAAVVQSWKVSNAMAFDLEPGSYPSVEWVADTANRMRQAGISPGIYGTAEGQGMYAAANPAWRWVANWSAPGGSVLSDGGWNVHQYTDSESVGGLTYDASIVGPGVMGPAQA
jgi:hypothetical protein